MQTLARLFGRSPFAPLQTHMNKVARCMEKMEPLFDAFKKNDFAAVEKVTQEISALEHEADLTKNDIRNHLPKGLFFSVDRGSLLEMLSIQDSLADKAEKIAVTLTLRKMEMPEVLVSSFKLFLDKNLESYTHVRRIIQELDELLESSFGGIEAEKVCSMVEDVAFKEHEADLLQRKLLKILLKRSERFLISLKS
jgi:uncharacterized protein